MDDSLETSLITSALDMALGRQDLTSGGLLSHSDRGVQYSSGDYRRKLEALQITASMSRTGNCYDNAFAESFFATLKKELIYRTEYKNKEEAKKAIFEYIEVWYNRKRIHSSIGYMTPVQFECSLAS
jgi:transposase InsO family protein